MSETAKISPPETPVKGMDRYKALHGSVIKTDSGRMRFLITSGILDRDGEILDPDGMIVDRFKQNPVMLWCHDMYLPAIAIWPILDRTERGWEAEPDFVPAEINAFADQIRRQYEAGYLKAVSIRFRPIEWISGKLEVDGFYTKFTKFELLEISAVNIPANQEALRVRGMDDYHAYVKKLNCRHCGACGEEKEQPPRNLAEDGSAEHSQAAAGATLTVDAEAAASSYYCVVLDENGQVPKDITDAWKDVTISWNDETGIHTSKIEFVSFDETGTKWVNINSETKGTDAGAVPPAPTIDAAEAAAQAAPTEPAQGTPGAEPGETSKTDDGGIGLDDLCGEPEPIAIDDAVLTERVNAEIERQLAERKAYLSGRSAVAHLLPEN